MKEEGGKRKKEEGEEEEDYDDGDGEEGGGKPGFELFLCCAALAFLVLSFEECHLFLLPDEAGLSAIQNRACRIPASDGDVCLVLEFPRRNPEMRR